MGVSMDVFGPVDPAASGMGSYYYGPPPGALLPYGFAPQAMPFPPSVPLFQGYPHRPASPFPIPFGPSSILGSLSSFVQAPLQQWAISEGYFPAGLSPGDNFLDRLRAYQIQQRQAAGIAAGQELDRAAVQSTLRGIANLTGTPFGIEQVRAAQALSGLVMQVAPTAARIDPDLVESLMGPTGSAFVLSSRLADYGRFRVDPVTGYPGLTEETIGAYSSAVYDLYRGRGRYEMAGVTMGDVGQLFGALQQRGVLPSPPLEEEIRGLSDQEIRRFDANRTVEVLKKYTGVIRAMREVFGDAGNPNAPIPELIQALEQMTQGAAFQISAQDLETRIRKIRNQANATGLGVEGLAKLTEFVGGASRQEGLGGLDSFRVLEDSAAYAAALSQVGVPNVSGASSIDALVQRDVLLRQRAIKSEVGSVAGAALRLFGGDPSRLEGEALEYVTALKQGKPSFGPDQRSIASVSPAEFMTMFRTAASEEVLGVALGQTEANRSALVAEPKAAAAVRASQNYTAELNLRTRLAGFLTSMGLDPEMAKPILEKIESLGPEAADLVKVEESMTRILSHPAIDLKDPDYVSKLIVGELKQAASQMGVSWPDLWALTNKEVFQTARIKDLQAKALADIQQDFSRLGRAPLAASIIGALQSLREGEDLSDLILRGVGGVPLASAKEAGIQLEDLSGIQAALQTVMKAVEKEDLTSDPEDKKKATAVKEDAIRELRKIIESLPEKAMEVFAPVPRERSSAVRTRLEAMRESAPAAVDRIGASPLNQRGSKFDEYRASEEGRKVVKDAADFVLAADVLASSSLVSTEALRFLGEEGSEEVRKVAESVASLRALAYRYSDKDVSRLLLGGFSAENDKEARRISEKVQALVAVIDESSRKIDDIVQKGGATEEFDQDKLSDFERRPIPGTAEAVARRMSSLSSRFSDSKEDKEKLKALVWATMGREDQVAGYLSAVEDALSLRNKGEAIDEALLRQAGPFRELLNKDWSLDDFTKAVQSLGSSGSAGTSPTASGPTKVTVETAKVDVKVTVTIDGKEVPAEAAAKISFEGASLVAAPA